MKHIITFLAITFITTVHAQTVDFNRLLDSAKTLFKSEKGLDQEALDRFDYGRIVSLLEKAIALNPENAEARYFLGYTYSRINSRDGRSMIAMNPDLLMKTSEQFEKVNDLSPEYKGEFIVLDPYSKIGSEWGSMAMSYWHNNNPDSAKWAFNQGRLRGGFGNYILELNRNVLNACSKNAILISSGDNFTIPLWYLQIVEGHRTDVSVVDISLLNAGWYPSYLSKNKIVSFDLPKSVLDTVDYYEWKDTTITINRFSWTVKPSYYDGYLLRGDRVFLSLLQENKFQRDVYFTIAFTEEARLSLKDHLQHLTIVDKLTTTKITKPTFEEYKKTITHYLRLSEFINPNSHDELMLFDNFRYDLFDKADHYLAIHDTKKAKELLDLLDQYGHERKFPYLYGNGKAYVDYLRQRLQK